MEISYGVITEINDIVDLLNKTTLFLLDKNIFQWTYPWDSKEIEKDISLKYQFAVKDKEKIIAVFSLKPLGHNLWGADKSDSMYLYRIAVLPEHQGKNVGQTICSFIKQKTERDKIKIYLNCWAGNEKLRRFYTGVGFRYKGDYPENDYYVSVFSYG